MWRSSAASIMAAGGRRGGGAGSPPPHKEPPLADPAQRTKYNVRDSNACMIVIAASGFAVSKGTALAQELAHRCRKPLIVVDLGEAEAVAHAALWLRVQQRRLGTDLALAIGGPRGGGGPGIFGRAKTF